MRQSPSRHDRSPFLGSPLLLGLLLATALAIAPATGAAWSRVQSDASTDDAVPRTVVVPRRVLASMNERFVENNEHWEDAPRMNSITQMLRSGRPTQLEYLGCLKGEATEDTIRVRAWVEARDLVQLQFGVDGSCDHVSDLLGTWHTHPYRADLDGSPIKSRGPSPSDLESFAEGEHRMMIVLWDVDSLTAAVRNGEGEAVHPVPTVVR